MATSNTTPYARVFQSVREKFVTEGIYGFEVFVKQADGQIFWEKHFWEHTTVINHYFSYVSHYPNRSIAILHSGEVIASAYWSDNDVFFMHTNYMLANRCNKEVLSDILPKYYRHHGMEELITDDITLNEVTTQLRLLGVSLLPDTCDRAYAKNTFTEYCILERGQKWIRSNNLNKGATNAQETIPETKG